MHKFVGYILVNEKAIIISVYTTHTNVSTGVSLADTDVQIVAAAAILIIVLGLIGFFLYRKNKNKNPITDNVYKIDIIPSGKLHHSISIAPNEFKS